MLAELRIAGLGVIADTCVEFAPGMTVLTGETGAGKTMVVTSVGLLLGGRSDAGVVRRGSPRAVVEGRFLDAEPFAEMVDQMGGIFDDGELLVGRQVAASGRSRAFVGGAQVTAAQVRDVTGELVTIHGQSEQVRLGTPERQRQVLDRAGGIGLATALAAYRSDFARRQALASEVAELRDRSQERAREADLLTFGLGEIAAVDPAPGEDVTLASEANRLQSLDDHRMAAQQASAALAGAADDLDQPGAMGLLGMARKSLEQAARFDPAARALVEQAEQAGYLVDDLAATTSSYLADLDADPLRLETITERRHALSGLTRKYGSTIDEVLEWSARSATRLAHLQGGDERVEALESELRSLDADLAKQASAITSMRTRAASELASAVKAELAALAMPHARLTFDLQPRPELGPHGAESVIAMFTANPGSTPAPLAKVASGGELSRVRLALEVVLADVEPGQTFVFDEVDAGVGGAVAVEVGRRLARLARRSQVIVVTHLAQVAAFADAHLVIAKASTGEVTTSDVRPLGPDDRLSELARMMGGLETSESALAHAGELLAVAARELG